MRSSTRSRRSTRCSARVRATPLTSRDQHWIETLQRQVGNDAVCRILAADRSPHAVQREITFEGDARMYDPDHNNKIASKVYERQVAALRQLDKSVTVRIQPTGKSEAHYMPNPGDLSGNISVGPMKHDAGTPQAATEFASNIGSMAHEMQHALDDLTRSVKFRAGGENVLHTEWRAWAVQAAVTLEHHRASVPVTMPDWKMLLSFRDKRRLTSPESAFFKKTRLYLVEKKVLQPNPADNEVVRFMRMHDDWLTESLKMFFERVPEGISLDVDQLKATG